MSNMSATILREIVAKTFNVKATDVKLSGEIAPDKTWQDSFWNGSMGSSKNEFCVHGYSPAKGFVNISHIVGEYSGSNYAYSNTVNKEGLPLYAVEGIAEFIFFVVQETGHHHWDGGRNEEWENITLFKAPDFQEKLKQITKEDLSRWEAWLAE
jgi:hypothetical protein